MGTCRHKATWLVQKIGGVVLYGRRTDKVNAGLHAVVWIRRGDYGFIIDRDGVWPERSAPWVCDATLGRTSHERLAPARDWLRADIGLQPRSQHPLPPDRELRALLAAHRERVLDMLTDKAELATMHRWVAERDASEPIEAKKIVKIAAGQRANGHA